MPSNNRDACVARSEGTGVDTSSTGDRQIGTEVLAYDTMMKSVEIVFRRQSVLRSSCAQTDRLHAVSPVDPR